ncbi:MAG: TonB-dependent receptor [Opitutae bacterium]|nr:TonB-dependent receptor [Opitutae bacterium]
MINHTTCPSHAARSRLWCSAVALLAAPALLLAQTGGASNSNQEKSGDSTVKMDAFSVVGSRIKRVDAETPSPVVRITQADLQSSGFSNVEDAIRAMPFNTAGTISPEGSGTGFASGSSTVNFRGLGNNNTLVLINGRRAVPSGAGAFNGFQSVIDLRQIPTAAIESIEILKDGASAIYGSDAVAGVLNIVLKRSYTGVGMDVSFGNTFGTDTQEVTGFVIAGASTEKTSIVMTADYSHRNMLMNRDLAFSNNADLRYNKSATGQIETDASGDLVIGVDLRSSSSFPARFFIPGTATVRTFLSPTTDPLVANAVATSRATGAGLYNFQQDSTLLPENTTRGLGVYVKHQFTPQIYGFADLFFKRIETINLSAPAPFTTTDKGAGTNNRLLVPAANPYNPYGTRYFGAAGQAIELSTFRLVNAGPRVVDTTSDYPRYLFGLGGELPNDWSWEAAYMFAQGSFDNSSPGTAFDSRVQEALMGLNIGGQVLYANPFGPEDPRVTDYYSGTNPTKTKFTAGLYDASVSGTIANLPAGPVGAAFGVEYRSETLSDVRTLENETGNIVGGSEGFGYGGKRQVTSAYAELKIPVSKQIELQLAGRWEDYSDFGKTTKPKIALGWRPTKWLMLRGSFSESFKAPDLAFLYQTGSVSFTGNQLFDPRRPDQPSGQLKTVGRGNPDLQPEETQTTYFGVVIEVPRGPLKGLSFDVGYFKFDQTNLITRDSAAFTLANELVLPAGRVVRKALTPAEAAAGYTVGIIDYVATDWFNANKIINEGWDFGVNYSRNVQGWGNFRAGLTATYVGNFERETISSLGATSTIDIDGTDSVPLWRGSATLAWTKGDWAASVFVNYIGSYPAQLLTGPDTEPDTKEQWRINPQVSYMTPWRTKVTVGVRNVFDTDPPRYLSSQFGYNPAINTAEPAFWYVRLNREF